MKIFFFGRLGETIGREVEVEVADAGCSVADLRRRLAEEHPHAAAELTSGKVRACVDQEIALETRLVRPTEEVAFFPPLSGG